MPIRFHVGPTPPPPPGRCTLYFDAPAGPGFRRGTDLELSHFPGTERRHSGLTSTEMCLNFVRGGGTGDLAINPRVGINGVLSAYVLLQPSEALQHAPVLTQAAQMADYQLDGDGNARMLFQGLALKLAACAAQGMDALGTYKHCMMQIPRMLGGTGRDDVEVRSGIQALAASLAKVEQGKIQRRVPTPHFAQYVIEQRATEGNLSRALNIPALGAPLSEDTLLSPHARMKLDGERVHLVSVDGAGGWFHDLFFPTHCWTDAPPWWQPPGLLRGNGVISVEDSHPLMGVARELQSLETAKVTWMVPRRMQPFAGAMKAGRRFPVALACVDDDGKPAPSQLHPQRVGHALMRVFP